MAEGTLSQAEIDKLISQKSQMAETSTSPEVSSLPSAKGTYLKKSIPAQSAKPARPAEAESAPIIKAPAPPAIMRTDSSPIPASSPAPDLGAIITPLQTAIDVLTQRVDNTETSLARVNLLEQNIAASSQASSQSSKHIIDRVLYLEQEMAGIKNTLQTLSHELHKVFADFHGLNNQANEINRGLAGTIGYDIQQNFTCKNCGSHGYVSGLVKCTECEEEDWWGWWPPEE